MMSQTDVKCEHLNILSTSSLKRWHLSHRLNSTRHSYFVRLLISINRIFMYIYIVIKILITNVQL